MATFDTAHLLVCIATFFPPDYVTIEPTKAEIETCGTVYPTISRCRGAIKKVEGSLGRRLTPLCLPVNEWNSK